MAMAKKDIAARFLLHMDAKLLMALFPSGAYKLLILHFLVSSSPLSASGAVIGTLRDRTMNYRRPSLARNSPMTASGRVCA